MLSALVSKVTKLGDKVYPTSSLTSSPQRDWLMCTACKDDACRKVFDFNGQVISFRGPFSASSVFYTLVRSSPPVKSFICKQCSVQHPVCHFFFVLQRENKIQWCHRYLERVLHLHLRSFTHEFFAVYCIHSKYCACGAFLFCFVHSVFGHHQLCNFIMFVGILFEAFVVLARFSMSDTTDQTRSDKCK